LTLAVLVISGGMLMALATVSRGSVLACSVLLLVGAVRLRRIRWFSIVAACLIVVAKLLLSADTVTGVATAIFTRTSQADGSTERLIAPVVHLFSQLASTPQGRGLGLGQGAVRRYGADAVIETELARVTYEIGAIGFAGFLAIYFGAVVHLVQLARKTRHKIFRGILVISVTLCGGLMYSGVIFNHVSSLVFWGIFSTSCIFVDLLNVPEFKVHKLAPFKTSCPSDIIAPE
jgi:hypothetical protein